MLFNIDLTADNPAGPWHGLSSPDPANRQGAPSTTLFNMISHKFTSPKPSSSREVISEGTRSNVVSPYASSTHLSIGEGEDENEPEAIENPPAGDSTDIKPPEKRVARTKTSFQLAHPPRNARHERLRIRPKLLLQLQQISKTARPVPTLDVVPSAVFGPKIINKRSGMFKGKDRAGPNDLVVVTSESYKQSCAAEDNDNTFSSEYESSGREVIATICPARKEEGKAKGKAEICLNGGLAWEATLLPNGSYDFVALNEHGLQTTVRWARRSKSNRRASGASTIPGSAEENRRFTFSIIDPTTRRHPVIASMTRKSIDVVDQHPTSSATKNTAEGTTSPSETRTVIMETDDKLRALIVVTGIWVAFREGWSNLSTMGTLQPPASPTVPRSPMSPTLEQEKEEQPNIVAKEPPRSSFHTVRSKLLHKHQAPATTESNMPAVPETQPTRTNSTTQPSGHLTVSTAGHANTGTSQPNTPRVLNPVPVTGNKEENPDHSVFPRDNDDDQGSRDNRQRSNTHPPSAEKGRGKRWRRLSSMLDSMGRKDKSGHAVS
ncbi:hypothetical protein FQN54_001083 [Arachnomyces sp. PD_36]|nr:hypothetical protein FQN54_001083 [Arachnomyces sp. PD_36]